MVGGVRTWKLRGQERRVQKLKSGFCGTQIRGGQNVGSSNIGIDVVATSDWVVTWVSVKGKCLFVCFSMSVFAAHRCKVVKRSLKSVRLGTSMAIKTLTDFEFISAVKWLCLRLYMSVHSVFLAFTACFIYFHFISYY